MQADIQARLLAKYGEMMTMPQVSKETATPVNSLRNRRDNGTLKLPFRLDGRHLKAATRHVAEYIATGDVVEDSAA